MQIFAVITGDIVKSRKIAPKDIDSVINSLKEVFGLINDKLLNKEGAFEIFRGDSFQGIVPYPEKALLISFIIRAHLRSFIPSARKPASTRSDKPIQNAYSDSRVSVGIGNVSYRADKVIESHGEAFERSGHLFDRLKKEDGRLGIVTPWPDIDKEFEVECKLTDAVVDHWTPSTAEAVFHHLLYNKNQYELAALFNISQPALRKRLVVVGNINSIDSFISRYEQLITDRINKGGSPEF
ncbi:MAG: hypothetical protein Q8858_13620 [Bacteroidota bacterium]|nr:hypothetical protein [Bacteroidota bacterium]MDP4197453.1 hypothetical protein [Bacteroidota bacterium]